MEERGRNEPTILARIKRGQVDEATDMLLKQMPSPEEISHQDDGDGDALFWAACKGYRLLVELLLMFGAKVNNKSLASGGTPLHAAADNGNADIIEILLEWGSDVSIRNYFRDTACHLAAFRGHSQCVALLLKAGTNVDLKNLRQNTVLDEAKYGQLVMESGQHAVIKHLIYSHQHSSAEKHNTLQNGECTTKEHSKQLDHKDRSELHTHGDAYCRLKQLTTDAWKSSEKHS